MGFVCAQILQQVCPSRSEMASDELVSALERAADFLDECDRQFYRPSSEWEGWASWAKLLRDWRNRLLAAGREGDCIGLRRILLEIHGNALSSNMGSLSDSMIIDENRRLTVKELNEPLTPKVEAANIRKDELLEEIRRLVVPRLAGML